MSTVNCECVNFD